MNRPASAVSLVVGMAVGLVVTSASAEPAFGAREEFWQAQAGVRVTRVSDAGFDPFADDDALAQFSLGLSRTIWSKDRLSFAPGVVWDYGTRSGSARGQATNLVANRLTASLEGRYHFAPFAYALLRFAPGAVHQSAELTDPLAPAPLVASNWAFTVDASAGAAFLLGPQGETIASPVRWWLAGEGGYGFSRTNSLLLRPDLGSDDPRRTGDLDFGGVKLGGAFFRIYGAVTY